MPDQSDTGQDSSVHSRACENCRVRKTRCDKKLPCSSCRSLGLDCQPAVRPTEHRPRIIVSSQYERQIELIQERLASIEQSLLQAQSSRSPPNGSLNSSAPHHDIPASTTSTGPEYEGDSAFSTSTHQACHAANLTAATVAEDQSLSDIARALSSLKTSLHTQRPPRLDEHRLARSKLQHHHADLRLPPASFCAAVVRLTKLRPSLFMVSRSFHGHAQLQKLCQNLYFPSTQPTSGSVALTTGLLYYVARDLLADRIPELEQYDCVEYLDMLEETFATALSDFESLMVPTLESVQALLLGVYKAQEESKLSLGWMYLGSAHSMCQALGMHRKSTVFDDPLPLAELKRNMFWMLYWSDKTLSVNLGRASRFQDYDIDVELFAPSSDAKQSPWDLLNIGFVKLARLTGQVYDKLYASNVTADDEQQHERNVGELAAGLMACRAELLSVDMANSYFPKSANLLFSYTDSICYSVLSLIYRVQGSSSAATRVSARCYEAAKLSLTGHLRCYEYLGQIEDVNEKKDWIIWAMLYPSFMPFLIVFTHAIASFDPSDVCMLHDTVVVLEATRDLSYGTARLYEVCRVFLNTAEVLIESRRQTSKVQYNEDGSLLLQPLTDQSAAMMESEVSGFGESANLDMSDENMSDFLAGWIGTNRPVTDMLSLWNETTRP